MPGVHRTKLTFRNTLLVLGISLTGIPLLLFGAVMWWQNQQLRETSAGASLRAAQVDLDHTAEAVYRLCENSRTALEHDVRENLHSAKVLAQQAGGIHTAAGAAVSWAARNQFTKAASNVALPRMFAGGIWLGQVSDARAAVPVVDSVQTLTKATSTIFQRMNAAGDMLRVATNVIGDDGKRAIGTFIPATGADGTPNPVVSAVLRRETFVGRAFVVNGWYMAAYEPLLDDKKNVAGMIYVGVPEATATEPLRKAIVSTKVGNAGYIYVINATGPTRGHYVISKMGQRDGEDIWSSRDSQGSLFIQEICRKALLLKAYEKATQRYPWQNADNAAPVMRVARISYFQPWDWVIGVNIPEQEVYESVVAIDQAAHRWGIVLVAIGFAMLVASCATWYFMANGLTRRTDRIVRELNQASHAMASVSEEVSAASEGLAQDANAQAASNERVTSSLEQMGSMSQRNLDHSRMLKQLAAEARGAADGGAVQVRAMTETMNQIQASGAEVVKINKIIDEIAFQTNILALNAAVEAARAGEAGLGFAVVADEVRGLSRRCSQAAHDTSDKIQKSMGASQQGVLVTGEVAEKLQVIATNTRKLDELAQSVAAASEQQSIGINQINMASSQMSRGIQSTAANAEEGARRAGQFTAQARTIEELANELSSMFRTGS